MPRLLGFRDDDFSIKTTRCRLAPGLGSNQPAVMRIGIMTDMEGLAGVDHWDQCYALDDNAPEYRHGLAQLAADTNATIAGCFEAGATEVVVWDGHGRNGQQAFTRVELDPRAVHKKLIRGAPLTFDGLDETMTAVLMVGQHAMAGTIKGFLDHTQQPKEICRYRINGEEHGEMSQFALFTGARGVPLVHVSGDEALCAEAARLFPWVQSTPTKRGTSWSTCERYDLAMVRANIRRDVTAALADVKAAKPWTLPGPINVSVEYAYSALADERAVIPGVRRPHARTVEWTISDARFIYNWPTADWQPA